MSVPNYATAQQIKSMQTKAEEMMKRDGLFVEEEVVPGQTTIMNPMLAHYEDVEPVEESEEYVPEVQEEEEEELVPVTASVSSQNQNNIRDLRKSKEKAERERDEMMRQILMYQQQQQKQVQVEPEEVEEDPFAALGIDDESLVEGKHLKEMVKEIKNLKKTIQSQQQQNSRTSQDALDIKLRNQFPDIHQVLTAENIEMFRNLDPDLAETIGNNQDTYKKASMAYKMIKQYGIYKDPSFDQEKAVAQKNALKPKPLASVSPQQGNSPLSRANTFANGLTPDLKKQLHQEMIDAMKGR